MLVRFKDIDDPKTVERLLPEDLQKTLGATVRLVKVVVETTSETPTFGIEKVIPWLPWPRDRPGLITGKLNPLSPEPERRLVEYAFIRSK